jgi:hypothetical protein
MKFKFTIFVVFCGFLIANAQEQGNSGEIVTVSGTVKNEKGQRLKGVDVAVKPAVARILEMQSKSLLPEFPYVKTNMAGKYSIQVHVEDSLTFDKEGYWSKTIAATDKDIYNVVLWEHNLGQQYTIIGIVEDDHGNKLDDVSVFFKSIKRMDDGVYKEFIDRIYQRTRNGGYFNVHVFEKGILIFKKTGYDTVDVPVSDLIDQDNVKIIMKKTDKDE